ncbi:MAG: hypothetical protein ACK53L_04515, partial [Pirellulaceae bacterium]
HLASVPCHGGSGLYILSRWHSAVITTSKEGGGHCYSLFFPASIEHKKDPRPKLRVFARLAGEAIPLACRSRTCARCFTKRP